MAETTRGLRNGCSIPPLLPSLADHAIAYVCHQPCAAYFRRFKPEVFDAVQEPFARSQDDRCDVEPQLVD